MNRKDSGCTGAGALVFGRTICRAVAVLAAGLLVAGGSVWAQSNPSTCTKTGPALLLTELRDLNNDGVGETPIVGSKIDGETIYYQASLFISTATGQCAYEGGTLCIDRPGASPCVDVTPVGGIPLLCDNDAVCDPDGIAAIDSKQIAYVVNHLDFETGGLCDNQVRAVAEYHNGTSHFGGGVFPINADTPICNPVLFCGDSIVGNTTGETCDPPGQPGGANGNTCRANCTVCGDNILDAGEDCDDGNTNNTDACSNTCTFTARCGDSIVGNTPGETCDPPGSPAGANGNTCRANCTVCGDGVVDSGEACDDGDSNNTNACANDCTLPCSVIITKTVAPDDGSGGGTACDGVADGPFVETVTVDETSCVVYEICVENTGGQTLDSNGVTVSDPVLGSVNVNFGTIASGATVCKQTPGVLTAPNCTGGNPAGTSCICQEVEGVNTATITSAICDVTDANACAQPGSDCSDTANVACLGPGSCRMTGGHNYDLVDAEFDENGKVYTTGGQIGAPNESGCCELPPKGKCVAGRCTGGLNGGLACKNNDQCPNDPGRDSHCPWGDWEHNHHSGSDDSGSVTSGTFAFHSGTAAAPNEAFIKSVQCADPGWCVQARPAPFKQIFWEGTGVFRNEKTNKGKNIPLPMFAACGANQPKPFSKDGWTLHYYKAHVGDFGEPAGIYQKPADGCLYDASCANPEPNQSVEIGSCALGDVCEIDAINDPVKTELHPLCQAQACSECPDIYEIEIHCTADPTSPVAYRVSHFIREGNFQLHPPVGDSCNPTCGDGVCDPGVTGTAETCQSCAADCCPN